ncbi:hypothetical protein NQF87_05005 [Bombella sp. TMW 2.2559]|uniref:Uncharacterized protein n=1 Tax=Bombella dulcis TaxID=2967339 RepID=A0ABT3WB65_9PROT|nr:hypothetical protein [Bombella dulcis]MCX5616332.1 hypothetical protein [Bombella dulcis]
MGLMAVTLDPSRLPQLDILALARSGLIVRAERETPEIGIPSFLTRAGWNELIANHRRPSEGSTEHEPEEQTASRLLPALERICTRLLGEAAREAETQQQDASIFTIETDLFPSSPETRIILVADRTHPVACALIGTPEQITQLLASSRMEAGQA